MSERGQGERDPGSLPTLVFDGVCATIRLNRPALHNRIEPEDLAELGRLLDHADSNPALRVLVVTGSGRSFSSGYNIGKIGAGPSDGGFAQLTDRLERFRLPTICALNGGVYGGSTDLALACDFRIGINGVQMLMPAARLGLHYYPGGLRRYVDRLGLAAAKRLFLTAQPIDTAEMLRIGYLDEVVAPERLEARVAEWVAILAANAPLAVQGMKAALNAIGRGEVDLEAIAAGQAACARSADLAEGRDAWLEKRTPRFSGT
jgi:enoyl-CoA hydratase